ncbi:hypothetical protein [Methylomicrobium sp. Wu6]|uniref:hypothetical protein n=1 Tax=Methylomicrobium sp. Wu6 TaxID=3107928 RepID=UPI002DD66DDF|nr:hypothetical protein [Methylomicrobium sp. Wu6]MEC4750058.1 hypothetical protein [Methylomicrobium sp. Wu6]
MPFKIDRALDQLKAESIARINAKTGDIINARMPFWRQLNNMTRVMELQDRGKSQWSQSDRAERDTIQSGWDWIKSVKSVSNVATAAVKAAQDYQQVYAAEKSYFDSISSTMSN